MFLLLLLSFNTVVVVGGDAIFVVVVVVDLLILFLLVLVLPRLLFSSHTSFLLLNFHCALKKRLTKKRGNESRLNCYTYRFQAYSFYFRRLASDVYKPFRFRPIKEDCAFCLDGSSGHFKVIPRALFTRSLSGARGALRHLAEHGMKYLDLPHGRTNVMWVTSSLCGLTLLPRCQNTSMLPFRRKS